MRTFVAILALLAPVAAVPAASDRDTVALRALEALRSEDPAAAEALLAPFEPYEKASEYVRYAVGALRFHQQRYQEALELFRGAGKRDPYGYVDLTRAAREITKDHVRFESEHFVVTHPKGKDEVLVPYLVETLEKQRAALEKGLGWVPPGKVAVEIVADAKQLAELSTLDEESVRTTGTVAVAKFNKLMILTPRALLKGYDWLDTAAHEYTHNVVTARTGNRAPLWMQEGLAKWFEQAWRGKYEPVTPFSAALLREAAGKKNLVTFAEMHPSFAKLPTPERAALAYAQVALAVEWLVKQRGSQALAKVTARIGEGKAWEAAMAEAAGVSWKKFQDDWTRYMGQRPLPRGGKHELEKLRFKDDPKKGTQFAEWAEIPDEESRGYARLGEIFRERGRWSSARMEYAKAYGRVGARFPILSGRYALAAVQAGAKGEAEKVLSEALAWNPDYPALNLQMSRLLFDRGNLAAARAHLTAANRVDPFDPEIHAGLARVLDGLGDTAGAERERRFTRILTGQETNPP